MNKNLVIVRGGGDVATGTIQKLNRVGFDVLVLEIEKPTCIRRNVAVAQAIFDGDIQIEDIRAVRCENIEEIKAAFKGNLIAVAVDPEGKYIEELKPVCMIDGILAKKNLGTNRDMAPITIGLGPGFEAGSDVDLVIETNRGHDLGRLIFTGPAAANTGNPGNINGYTTERIEDGKVNIYCAASDLGQGAQTVFKQMALDVLGLRFDQINIIHPNSRNSPDSGTSSGSRQTLISGEAIKKVTEKLKIDLDKVDDISKLEGKEYFHEYFDPTDPLNSEKENPVSHIAYGFSTNVVILNDDGTIRKVVAATDAGKVINPKAIEGQLEGGIVMGLGYALTEDFKLDRSKVKAKYGTLGLWRAPMIPEIETTFVAKPDDQLLDRAFGAKGVGEIATIPIAPAVQGAYYKLDGILRRDFPMVETAYSKPKKKFNE